MIEERSYANFSRLVHEEVNPKRIPVNGTIEVTNRCPLDCAHCYNNLPMHDPSARRAEMSLQEHQRLLDELAELGCLWLLYSGGEIFARADFLEIYRYAIHRGFLVTLFTNGTLITERVADALAELPPFCIEITLYGRTRKTYEALTGVPGSWARCMRGIHLLLERRLPLKLKTVAVSINRHEIGEMRQFAQELGCEFKFDPMINPRIDCSSSPLAVRLTPEEIVMLDLQTPERVAEWRRLAIDHAPAPPPDDETPQVYDCGGGVSSFAVDPFGDLSICVLSHVDRYNVRTGTFKEGWEKDLARVRDRRITRRTKCTNCALKSLCGSCAANGELENGDAEAPVDFLCRTAHLRAEVFGVDVRPHGECEYCREGSNRAEIDEMAERVRANGVELAPLNLDELPIPASHCASGGCSGCSVEAARR